MIISLLSPPPPTPPFDIHTHARMLKGTSPRGESKVEESEAGDEEMKVVVGGWGGGAQFYLDDASVGLS